jgi:hypothetical protein
MEKKTATGKKDMFDFLAELDKMWGDPQQITTVIIPVLY